MTDTISPKQPTEDNSEITPIEVSTSPANGNAAPVGRLNPDGTPMVTPAGKPVPGSVPEGYEGSTPLMKQYFATCQEHPGIILLMRVGDFYEAYGEGAEIIARDLNITLTGREDGGVRVPMAGVPHHAMERYVARLIRKGRRIAIMDQVEDPKFAKGLVKRKVTRVVTPGTILEDNMLDAKSNNYLVAAVVGDPVAGVGIVDVSTGEFLTTEIDGERRVESLLDEIMRLEPAEILVSSDADPELVEALRASCSATITPVTREEGKGKKGKGQQPGFAAVTLSDAEFARVRVRGVYGGPGRLRPRAALPSTNAGERPAPYSQPQHVFGPRVHDA